jgi:4,5-dihydroxyphthalate decarboxylase
MITRRSLLQGTAGLGAALMGARAAAAAPSCRAERFSIMIGDYPHTHALHIGAVRSDCVTLDIAPVKVPATAFARAVAGAFDVSELALVTFLMAKAYGRKLVLLPAVTLSRFQHPYMVYNSEKGVVAPKDLEHARIGTRLYTATTPTWLRGILADDYGVDFSRSRWVTYQKPNVPEYKDPPNVSKVAFGTDMIALLLKGELDAAVADPIPDDPRLKPVIADPDAAAKAWAAKHRAIQVNHMVVVKEEWTRSDPGAVREVWRMLKAAKAAAHQSAQEAEFTPFGFEANRRNVEVAVDYVYRSGLIPRRFKPEELFNDLTGSFV